MSGTRGTVCKSIDGGVTFDCKIIPGYDSTDFRSIYAFDKFTAIIGNTGSPAKILMTTDGGQTWKETFSNEHVAAFIDGIDFWNSRDGILYGDPIDGALLLAVTHDGGLTWIEMPEEKSPQLVPGEASFAASGTAIRCIDENKVVIASGGKISRMFISDDQGSTWKWVPTPVLQGNESTGIFSIAFRDTMRGVVTGGDYKNDSLSKDHVFLTNDGGNNWQSPSKPTRGYRECVEYISDKQLIAAGPSGIDISSNGGLTWEAFSDEKKFHVVRKSRNGKKVFVIGGGGKIGIIN